MTSEVRPTPPPVYKHTGYTYSDQPPLSLGYILKLFGCGFIAFGIAAGWWGWWTLITGRLRWGLHRRLSVWLPANLLAAALFWHGLSLLLGV